MAYSKDTREMVCKISGKGTYTYEEVREEPGVGIITMKEWKKLPSETESLDQRRKQRSASKFQSDSLESYIEKYPGATLKNIADHFGGSTS